MKSLFASVASFIGKYADEAEATGNVLNSILAELPINGQTRASIQGHIDRLAAAPVSIRDWLAHAEEPAAPEATDPASRLDEIRQIVAKAVSDHFKQHPIEVPTISKSDIEEAVAAYLKANPPATPAPKSGK